MKKIERIITAAVAAVIFTAAAPPVAAESTVSGAVSTGHGSFTLPRFSNNKGEGAGDVMQIPSLGSLKKADSDTGLPERFTLQGTEHLTSVKDQTGFGTCWAHSAAASAESSIAARVPYIDLSEFHPAFYTYFDQIDPDSGEDVRGIFDIGGNCYHIGNLWSQWVGPVSEKRMPYGDLSFANEPERMRSMSAASDYHMRDAHFIDYDKDRSNFAAVNRTIKEFVYSGAAVDVSFYNDTALCYDSYFNSTNSRRKPRFADHSVAIVGWDDDFPAGDFLIPAENDGAWLVKNSWGSGFGEEGFMWISYEDTSLCEFAVFELEDADRYTRIFRNDSYVPLQSMAAADDPAVDEASYAASVFTAEEDTQIDAVSLFVCQPDTRYEISLYTSLTDMSDPTSGTKADTVSGQLSYTGYATVDLRRSAVVRAGEPFAVVMRLQCDNSPFVVPIESCIAVDCGGDLGMMSLGAYATVEQLRGSLYENRSLYSTDGADWDDMYGGDYMFTEEEKSAILRQFEEELFDGLEPEDTELRADAEMKMDLYTKLFERGDVYLVVGNITIKALGNPVNTPFFDLPSGKVGEGETVTVSSRSGDPVFVSVNGGDYHELTEPLEITELTNISATIDHKHFISRTYVPIGFVGKIGDVDGNGSVDAADASLVLEHYSSMSTGRGAVIGKFMEEYADIAINGQIDASDASAILELYAELSTRYDKQS